MMEDHIAYYLCYPGTRTVPCREGHGLPAWEREDVQGECGRTAPHKAGR